MRQRLSDLIHHPITNLVISILIFVSILLLMMEFSEAFDHATTYAITVIGDVITFLFVIELSIRFYVAPKKSRYFRQYWLDILSVVPIIRPLRVFRMLRLLRLFRLGTLMTRTMNLFQISMHQGRGETLLIVVSIFVIVVTAGFGIHLVEGGSRDFDEVGESMWWSLLSLIAGEPIGPMPRTDVGRGLVVVVMIGGMTLFATFTGVVSALMTQRLRWGMEAKAMEIEDLRGHILICGWNRQAHLLIEQFQRDDSTKHIPIVALGEFEDQKVLDEIKGDTSLVYIVQGDPTKVENLRAAGAERAAFAVLLADKLVRRSDSDRDARTILTALTLEKMKPQIYTVAELLSYEGADHLHLAGVEEVIVADEIASSMIATSLRNRGIFSIVHEMFTAAEGCQFYKCRVPDDLIGKTFGEILNEMKRRYDAIVVSLERQDGTGPPQANMNPGVDRVVTKDELLVVLANADPNGG
ncbi:MAG: ion transporter [Deltaproteobacteria bacterium]|nr:ion transporter [Deltaproteobacteria bacterium]MCB9488968.1 ion transporter [Deltaproteobacteria bacterium]